MSKFLHKDDNAKVIAILWGFYENSQVNKNTTACAHSLTVPRGCFSFKTLLDKKENQMKVSMLHVALDA